MSLLIKKTYLIIFCIICICSFSTSLFADGNGKLSGIVLEEKSSKPLIDVKVSIFQNNQLLQMSKTDKDGKYNFTSLEFNKEYYLILNKAFYHQLKVAVAVKDSKNNTVKLLKLSPSDTNVKLLNDWKNSFVEEDFAAAETYKNYINQICESDFGSDCQIVKKIINYQNDPSVISSAKIKLEILNLFNNIAVQKEFNPQDLPLFGVPENDVIRLIDNLKASVGLYKNRIDKKLGQRNLKDTNSEQIINNSILELENSIDGLILNVKSKKLSQYDINKVIENAFLADNLINAYNLADNPGEDWDWKFVNSTISKLSIYSGLGSKWKDQVASLNKLNYKIDGTYNIRFEQSDDINKIVEEISKLYPKEKRDRVSARLKRRLESPAILAIEKIGKQLTIASSNSPQITFEADGVARTETMPNGPRTVNVTARTNYDGIAISYEGDRVNDFYVNFMPVGNDKLRVVRRVYLENRNETITVASVYDKVNQTANWSMVNRGGSTVGDNTNYGDFVVPNGTQLTAVLNNSVISTENSQDGDRFTMEVTSPSQFDGAIIEGRVIKAERSGRVSGRANLTLDFDTIRLRNGQTYRFAGIIDGVTAANGDDVKVNNEGTVRDNNQTTKTVTRAGIGAALGALIGAIAGGGQGAAIGAAIGAGAGAGTVFIEGRDNIKLGQGSKFMITSTSPTNRF